MRRRLMGARGFSDQAMEIPLPAKLSAYRGPMARINFRADDGWAVAIIIPRDIASLSVSADPLPRPCVVIFRILKIASRYSFLNILHPFS